MPGQRDVQRIVPRGDRASRAAAMARTSRGSGCAVSKIRQTREREGGRERERERESERERVRDSDKAKDMQAQTRTQSQGHALAIPRYGSQVSHVSTSAA